MSEYRFEELDLSPEGIREISGLLTSVFGREAGLAFEFLQWEYNDNPVGRAVGFNAWMGDELAAHYVTPQNSSENLGSKDITLTCSPYFSPNKAAAPIAFASSIGTFR
jgi:hypothetical protein